MHSKGFPFISDLYLKDTIFRNSPYIARNVLSDRITKAYVYAQETTPEPAPAPEQEVPPRNVPAAPAEPGTIPKEVPEKVGYLSVGVFTASGALPVEDAVVTVYTLNAEGEEDVISHLVTDINGRVPTVELPATYDQSDPLESSEYYFNTYNLRVQAINYYTHNILDFRIFPDTTTSFMINLIPVAAGPTGTTPGKIFVIPPSPVDISND